MRKWFWSGIVAITAAAANVGAAGFALYEHGAAATATAGAFIARANDPSAIYYNPAGISGQRAGVMLGTTLITPSGDFAGANPFPGTGYTAKQKDALFFPSHLYVASPLGPVTVGLGVFNPFGLGTNWPEDWKGRDISTKTEIQTYYFNPVVAYSVGPVSMAAGMQAVYGSLELNRKVKHPLLGDDVAAMHLEGTSDINYGFNAGVQFRPMPMLTVGASYRSQVDSKVNGTAAFDSMNAKWTMVKTSLPAKADVSTTMPYPAVMGIGVAVTPIPDLTIEANVVQTQWSTFDTLTIAFAAPYSALTEKTPEVYSDVRSYRIGAEYRLPAWSLALRCGYLFDESPAPPMAVTPLLPDADRDSFQVGAGYTMGKTTFDFAYMYLKFKERSTEGLNPKNFNGTYNTTANLFGFSVTHRF